MAIGTTAAILGSAVIGAGASAIGASKNSKAINKSSQANQQANREALAAQKEARAENLALQTPIYNAGLPAMNARNALLGLGGTAQAGQPQASTPTPQANQNALYSGTSMSGGMSGGTGYNPAAAGDVSPVSSSNFAQVQPNAFWRNYMNTQQGGQASTPTPQPTQQAPAQGQTAQQAAENAFDIFRNSTGYQFRLGEGMDAINSGYAGAGTIRSGAAMKGIQEYGQNFASNEFGNYMGMLGQQQNLSAGAANAMSGVNTTYANNASNLAMNNASNITNAAVAKANNSNALLGSIGGLAGNVLGGMAYGGGGGMPSSGWGTPGIY